MIVLGLFPPVLAVLGKPGHRDLPPCAVPRDAVPLSPRLMCGHLCPQTGSTHDPAHVRPARGAPGFRLCEFCESTPRHSRAREVVVKRIVYPVPAASAAAAVMSDARPPRSSTPAGTRSARTSSPRTKRSRTTKSARCSRTRAASYRRIWSYRDQGPGHARLPGARQARHEDLKAPDG